VPVHPGTRLGAYEIVSAIGAGGMGEVYRARDAKLNRDVAVKVLPAEFGGRPDALARFEREARAVAALSHPNILAIHDFGTANGISYAVMELLEGESLRQALADGALPPRRAVDYAIQIARGLAAAHDKGITHRDLKPENVFVTADERVKILDFGLARQDAPAVATAATLTPTITNPTEPGTVLGTVGYMAPEQVRGAAVDWRADIFSFGALFHEMVTGRRAFQRDTAAETMTAILREDPSEPAADRHVPPAIDRIIRHCLDKKPEARFRSAHDLAFALEAISGSSGTSTQSLPATAIADARRRSLTFTAVAVSIAIGLAAAAGLLYGRRIGNDVARVVSSEPPQFRQLTFNRGVVEGARFAPDGRTVVYSAAWDGGATRLFLTRLEFPGATAVSVPSAVLFAVSDNAEMAVGVSPSRANNIDSTLEGTLSRVPMLGGAARPMVDHVTSADWSPSGALAVARVVGSQQRLEYPIGTVLFETEGEIGGVRISPDGDRVAFLEWPVKSDDRGWVAVVDRKGVKRTLSRSWEAVRGLAWQPQGKEVWYSAASEGTVYNIWRSASGPADERRVLSGPGGIVIQDIAKDGKILIKRYDRSVHVEGAFDGSDLRNFSLLDFSWARDISRDGRRIALSYSGQGSSPNYDVYVRGVEDADATRIGEGQAQQFSPDGTSVLAVVHGPPARLVILPIGAREPTTVPTGNVTVTQARWLADGKRLIVVGTEPGTGLRAYVINISGGTPRAVTPERITFNTDQMALSPDGARVAFRSPEGVMTVYSTAGEPPIAARGVAAGELPIGWTGDNRSLLLIERKSERRLVSVDPSTGRRDVVKEIKPSDPALIGPQQVVLTQDGRSYVANYGRLQHTLFLVEGLK